jgi:nucleotide-binding universal stress UspA family protein
MTTLALEKAVELKNLLVATDFSEVSRCALAYAATLARRNGARLHIAHVLPPNPFLPLPLEPVPLELDSDRQSAERSLEELADATALGDVAHETVLERGPIAEVLSGLVSSREIDLLVVGTHGRGGLKKLVLGSVAEELFRSASCPVLTVGPRVAWAAARELDVKSVIFATDFSVASRAALPHAIALANEYGAQLVLVHMIGPVPLMDSGTTWCMAADVSEMREVERSAALGRLRASLPSDASLIRNPQYVAEFGLPVEGIVMAAQQWHAGLIVMGVRHRTPGSAAHLPWTLAPQVVTSAHCPVLTVKG